MLSTWPLIYLEKQYIDRQMYSKQSRRLLVKSQKDACLDNEKKVCFVSFYNEEKKLHLGDTQVFCLCIFQSHSAILEFQSL